MEIIFQGKIKFAQLRLASPTHLATGRGSADAELASRSVRLIEVDLTISPQVAQLGSLRNSSRNPPDFSQVARLGP